MKFIQESAWQYLSVKLPAWGAFIFGVLPVLIQEGVNTQLIAPQYHAMLLTVVLPALALFGKKNISPNYILNQQFWVLQIFQLIRLLLMKHLSD